MCIIYFKLLFIYNLNWIQRDLKILDANYYGHLLRLILALK